MSSKDNTSLENKVDYKQLYEIEVLKNENHLKMIDLLKNENKHLVKENSILLENNTTLISTNNELSHTDKKMSLLQKNLDSQIKSIIENNNTNKEYSINTLLHILREIHYSAIFKDTIINSSWLLNKSFSLNNSASNYSFLYILYRVLDEVKPENILEFGLGQTTKLTTQYVLKNNSSNLTVIEDNQEWINLFTKNLEIKDNTKIKQVDIEEFEYKNTKDNVRYQNLKEVLDKNKYNLIIVDGPRGYKLNGTLQDYPRTNICNLIDYLAEDFVVIFDDYNRNGEQNTVKEFLNKLTQRDIEYKTIVFKGLKHQMVVCSLSNEFITWM